MQMKTAVSHHRAFPTDEAAMKVTYLAITNLSEKWTMLIRDWQVALNRFAMALEGRFPL